MIPNKPPDPAFVLRGNQYPVNCLSFFEQEFQNATRCIATGNQDGIVSVWDLKVKNTVSSWQAHNSSVLWMKYLNPSRLWTCGRNENVSLWDLNGSSKCPNLTFPLGQYLGFSKCDVTNITDRSLLCVPGTMQESVTVYDVDANKRICCLIPSDPKMMGCVMQCLWVNCAGNKYILTMYENGTLSLWDWANNKIVSSANCNDNPLCVVCEPETMRGVCGTVSDKVFSFHIENATLKIIFDYSYKITNPGIASICTRPDGKIYATGGWDHRVRLFTWKSHKPLAVLSYHKKSVEALEFSKGSVLSFKEGCLLAAGSSDGSVSLWSIFN